VCGVGQVRLSVCVCVCVCVVSMVSGRSVYVCVWYAECGVGVDLLERVSVWCWPGLSVCVCVCVCVVSCRFVSVCVVHGMRSRC